MKELKSIGIKNLRKVAECIGIEPEMDFAKTTEQFEMDLLRISDAKNFVKKYEKYFTTTDQNLLREFYERTGLILMNILEAGTSEYYATMYGFLRQDSDAYGGYYNCVCNNHLTSRSKVDSSFEPNENEYYEHDYDKDEAWGFTNEELTALNKNPALFWSDKYEHCFKVGPHKNFVGAFGERFEIKDGNLYRDGKKIEENVETVFRLNDCTSIIVFKDYNTEYLEWHSDEWPSCRKYDKILYGTYFIAFLKDGNLNVRLINEEEENISHDTFFSNVEDIEFIRDPFEFKDTAGNLRLYTSKNDKNAYIDFLITCHQLHVWDYCK